MSTLTLKLSYVLILVEKRDLIYLVLIVNFNGTAILPVAYRKIRFIEFYKVSQTMQNISLKFK